MSEREQGLRSIHVRGLFGHRDFSLEIGRHTPTVLTGSNGTGKSTLLRLVYAASAGDLNSLVTAPVEFFRLDFHHVDNFSLEASPVGGWDMAWGPKQFHVEPRRMLEDMPEWALSALAEADYDPERAAEGMLQYIDPTDSLGYEELALTRSRLRGLSKDDLQLAGPEWLAEFGQSFPAIFVTDQRLVIEASRSARAESAAALRHRAGRISSKRSVDIASRDIASRIGRADSDYARASQRLDRQFPEDVISAMLRGKPVSKREVQGLVTRVDEERESLRNVGLLDSDTSYQPTLAPDSLDADHVRPVVATFLRSTLAKLAELEGLAERLTAFKEFLDGRFEAKSVTLSRRDGLRVALADGSSVRASELSSGEQQVVVLAYEILFRTENSTLVIIDEPEISLHVNWQYTLIKDLTAMAKPSGLQLLMATHSPSILAEHPEFERSLDHFG